MYFMNMELGKALNPAFAEAFQSFENFLKSKVYQQINQNFKVRICKFPGTEDQIKIKILPKIIFNVASVTGLGTV